MIRIIDGIPYEGKASPYFNVSAHELGHGHVEVSAVKRIEWRELDWEPLAIQDYLDCVEALKNDPDAVAEKAAKCLKISANRAKTRVRRLCKSMGADSLLTLTYRYCETDKSQVKKDLYEFNRRMRRELPEFRFVACFELQKRGAWHVHMATGGIPTHFNRSSPNAQTKKMHSWRVKSFDVIRAIWRSVVGVRGGNIDLARRKRSSASSPAKIAAYISKYILKDFAEGEKNSNRFTSYGDFKIPAPVSLGFVKNAIEAVEVCYSILGDRVVFGQHFSHFGDWFYLHGEAPPVLKRSVR